MRYRRCFMPASPCRGSVRPHCNGRRAGWRSVSRSYGWPWEPRHAFQGEVLAWGRISDAEWYAYSTVWLAFAGIVLAISLYGRNEWLRRAALAGIGLVAAKVFLSDM